jgi:branched-chain amino acid transport system substrate-binding protein
MENKNKKWLILGFVLAIVIIIGLGLFNKQNHKGELKIGVIASLTGPGAYFGEQLVNGLQMALADINANGGIDGQKVSLIIEDSKTDNTTALTVAKKLIDVDGVKVIIGDSWNGTTLTMMPYTNEKKVIVLSPNASLDAFTKDDYLFRLVPKTSDLMKPLAEYLTQSGVKTVAIAYAKSAFGDEHSADFKAEFEKRGGTIVSVESFDMKSTDVRTELTHIKAVKPDVIFDLHASGPSVGLLIAQGNQLGIKAKYVGTWSVENSALLKQYSKEIEGIIYPFIFSESESATTQNFSNKVKAAGKVSDTFIASGYDSLNIIAKVLTENKSMDGDSLKKSLLKIKNYDGVSGKLGFDQNGDIIKTIFMKTVKDGQFVKLGE